MNDNADHAMPGESTIGHREYGLVQRVRQRLQQTGWPVGASLLVGFSGGADSLALLASLAALRRARLVQLRAVHVDHGLRPTSSTEAATARRTAETLGVECEVVAVDPARLAGHRGVGVEEAARRERYRAFADVAVRRGMDTVVLGHHQADQAETVLLHLARGAGLGGAAGMLSLTTMKVPWWPEVGGIAVARELRAWRPLLHESVVEVRTFARSLALSIVDDPSNDDLALRRNAIRHEVLPALERAVPGAVAGLARFAALAAEDDAELDRQSVRAITGDVLTGERGVRRSALAKLPLALRRRVVRLWVAREVPSVELSADRVEAVLRACGHVGGRRTVELGQGAVVVVERDELWIDRRDERQR